MIGVSDKMKLNHDVVLDMFINGLEEKGLRKRIEKMYLFGSRARSTQKPDSDYDVLIVSSHLDKNFRDKLYDIVVDVLLEHQRLISLKIFKSIEFSRLCGMGTPFMKNILRDGVQIG